MKNIKFVLFGILLLLSTTLWGYNLTSAKTTLSGKVTDKENGQAIAGANVYIPDLKTGTVTKPDGTYKIDNLPEKKILIQVSLTGYKTIVETVDLSISTIKDFSMESSVTEIHEVVVTGTSSSGEKNKTPTPITVVTQTQLLQSSSSNIIDAVANQPGISQVTTGASISKPVIRGLGYNRVVVVNDGIRQEGQQWGDEHGIEIDEFAVSKVEILKGPASLAFGSDAIAGVINMISAPTLPDGTIKGTILSGYQSNNGQIGYSANCSGNQRGFIWDLRYSGKQAHAYRNRYDGYVYGSGFKENSLSGIIGLNKAWGYSHIHFSAYHLTPGIVEGERDSATGKFIQLFALNDSTRIDTILADNEMKKYTIGIPRQDIRHYKVVINNNFIAGNGNIKSILGFQQNSRQEFGNALQPDQYGLYLLMNTLTYDVRYIFPEKKNWHLSTGMNGMHQQSSNKGTEFLVPEYSLFDMGGFVTVKKSYKKLDISGGVRYDSRMETGKDLFLDSGGIPVTTIDTSSYHQFAAFNSHFSAMSGSMGATYQFSEKVFAKVNISRGFRAPNIGEAGSNGEHEGTGRYEIGDPKLKAETSLQMDYEIGINTQHISAEVDLFNNSISNFIYAARLRDISGGDSIMDPANPIPTFKFTQSNANLMGGEVMIDIHPHPLDWLHIENSFSYVRSMQKNASDSTRYLPFTPAPKISSDLRADIHKAGKYLGNAYVKLTVDNYFVQDRIYSAFGTETKTPGYTLVTIGMGSDLVSKKRTFCSVYLGINNLANVAYQNHLSRLKYAPVNYATGRTGVYNMGRNISIKLILPFDLKKEKE